MKKNIIQFASILLLLVAFSLLIYPTPYRFVEFETNGHRLPVKVNVLTGKTEIFSWQDGWEEVKNISP